MDDVLLQKGKKSNILMVKYFLKRAHKQKQRYFGTGWYPKQRYFGTGWYPEQRYFGTGWYPEQRYFGTGWYPELSTQGNRSQK